MAIVKASDGTRLYYEETGAGLPILCLSGLTRNARDFDYVAPYLDGFHVIRMDYRGRGQSAWADPDTYTIPHETQDVLTLVAHLELDRVAILGTSRGGLIAMAMAAVAKNKLSGVCLVDIGPEIDETGMQSIRDYVGLRPKETSFEQAVAMRSRLMKGFNNVPESRWRQEVETHYTQVEDGLDITYDPKLRDAVLAAASQPMPDLWPLFDGLSALPLALIRGANSDLLSLETVQEMRRRRPDMIYADVPDRGHVPFLDETQSLDALDQWTQLL